MPPFTLPEQAKLVAALTPATDAAGRAGAWVELATAHKAYILVHVTQGNAATVALTIQQAKDTAGTGSKAITGNVRIYANADTGTSDTLVRQTDATSFTTDAALASKQVVLEVDPASLDGANGFSCIRVSTGASNVANLTEAQYLLTPLRYAGDPPPSATA
jgi:hypothetical protein